MDLSINDTHLELREQVRRFIGQQRHFAPKSYDTNRKAPEALHWQSLLLANGYAGREIPRQYGGFGASRDILAQYIINEELSEAGVPAGFGGQGIEMVIPTLLAIGTERQRLDYIAPTLKGNYVWCQGFSEPEAGSDLASLKTTAKDDSDHFAVSGQKIWTSSAHEADFMHGLVRTERGERPHDGITYLIIPMSSPGIDVRPLRSMAGKGYFDGRPSFNEVFFTDVRVPKTNVIGEIGRGWAAATTTLRSERGMLGDAGKILSRLGAIKKLMHEKTDGAAAADDPVLYNRLVTLETRALAMKAHSMRLMTKLESNADPGLLGMIVKLLGCELNHQLSALAIDALGQYGILYDDSPYLRDEGVWLFRYMFDLGLIIGGGTAQIQKNIIAERGIGLPRAPARRPSGSANAL